MKKLVFKRWVEVINYLIGFSGLFMCAAFEWNSIIPYLIGISLMISAWLLGGLYGRD